MTEGDLDVATRRVLVLGLGVSGAEVARILAVHGAEVFASDAAEVDPMVATTLSSAGVELETGGHDEARRRLPSFDFAFVSPGISPVRGFGAEVCASPVPVVSELDLATRMTDAPVVAVTGTNGKTTVCRLAELIGQQAGLEVYACGNLETKFITAAHEHPDADAFVVEASSFSLAFCETFHPAVAVITSLAEDHLDWHGTFEHYRDAKAKIGARQRSGELFLYPAAQPELQAFAPAGGPLRVPFSDSPLPAGAWVEGSDLVARFAHVDLRAGGVGALASRGPHFAADAAAAAAAMAFLGADSAAIERALGRFRFDAHRIEFVGTVPKGGRGVRVYDDSCATNTHATLAAVSSFDEPIVLIAGGRNKGLELEPLASVADRLRAVVAIGEAAPELERVFASSGVFVPIAASMREAVAMAFERAKDGDVVLLSPACASHDMFANYAERGDAFQAACRDAGVAA